MKKMAWYLLLFLGVCAGCQRKLSAGQVKDNLINAMTDQLQKRRPAGEPPLKFTVIDVVYYEDVKYYDCEFKVKLTRPDGTDTTGVVRGKVSKDFSTVK